MGIKRADLVGQEFGLLTVVGYVGKNKHSQTIWACTCRCGGTKDVGINALRNGMTRSCGCLRKGPRTKRPVVPGRFRCQKCKKLRPLSQKLLHRYRCTRCGPPDAAGGAALAMWRRTRNRARIEGIPFSISVDDVVIPATCPVLGIPIVHGTREDPTSLRGSPSIDRLVPALGYVPGNINVISNRANILKRDGTLHEFVQLVRWLEEQEANGK